MKKSVKMNTIKSLLFMAVMALSAAACTEAKRPDVKVDQKADLSLRTQVGGDDSGAVKADRSIPEVIRADTDVPPKEDNFGDSPDNTATNRPTVSVGSMAEFLQRAKSGSAANVMIISTSGGASADSVLSESGFTLKVSQK